MSTSSTSSPTDQFGPNEWLVDEMYQRFLEDPNGVDPAWHDFFADYRPGGGLSDIGADDDGEESPPAEEQDACRCAGRTEMRFETVLPSAERWAEETGWSPDDTADEPNH